MGAIRPIKLVLACVIVVGSTLWAFPQEMIDNFGQAVSRELDDQTTYARELRIKNYGREDNIDKSIVILNEIVNKKPDYYRAWYNLGLAYYSKHPDNPENSITALNMAINIQNKRIVRPDKSIFNTIGYIYLNSRRYDEAEKYLNIGLNIDDSNKWTDSALLYNLGRLYFEKIQYDKSLEYLNRAIDEFGNPAAIELKAVVEKTKQ